MVVMVMMVMMVMEWYDMRMVRQGGGGEAGSMMACVSDMYAGTRSSRRRWSGRERGGKRGRTAVSREREAATRTTERGKTPRKAAERARAAPHSGYHADFLPRRFFEGWYFKVTLEDGDAFAFMFSVEDPYLPLSPDRGVGVQIMGPQDTYMCQFDRDTSKFAGDPRALALSHVFEYYGAKQNDERPAVPDEKFFTSKATAEFFEKVKSGFLVSSSGEFCGQISSTITRAVDVASMREKEQSRKSDTLEECKWCFRLQPNVWYGGSAEESQKSTGGWLSTIPIIFDPHWQILISDGVVCDGFIEWRGKKYTLNSSNRIYAEKNWGSSFPKKWFWVQCNSGWKEADVDDRDSTSVPTIALTAGGGLRDLPITNTIEQVALITVHIDGLMYEFVPWTGKIMWEIAEWGMWKIEGFCSLSDPAKLGASGTARQMRATLRGETSCNGVVLCAPSANGGLRPLCRDSFRGYVHLVISDEKGMDVINVVSTSAALEIGGGPWFGEWKAESDMNVALKSLLNLPFPQTATDIPSFLLPPGL